MIMISNLHSMTKLSGWRRHWQSLTVTKQTIENFDIHFPLEN